jgi:hypothetical protein
MNINLPSLVVKTSAAIAVAAMLAVCSQRERRLGRRVGGRSESMQATVVTNAAAVRVHGWL